MKTRSHHPPLALLSLLLLPLIGVALDGQDVRTFLEFPPLTVHRTPAATSWPAVTALAAIEIAFYAPVVAVLLAQLRGRRAAAGRMPVWGWFALAWTAAWWLLAWTRQPWFAPLQQHTFTPLWLGYIAVVNALTVRRCGRSMVSHDPLRLIRLAAWSAVFWWFFEYLNRFVQNWHYVGIADLGPVEYVLFATPAFTTVLPAVMSTAELFEAYTPTKALTRCPIRLPEPRGPGAWLLLAVAAAGLAGIGVWPDQLFPLLWLSPLFVLTAASALRGRPTVVSPAAAGDWRRIALLSQAALVCGFFWEMWNFHSEAKWIYLVPYVGVWKIFEMPLLGFAGYLPFGWECAAIADAGARPSGLGDAHVLDVDARNAALPAAQEGDAVEQG